MTTPVSTAAPLVALAAALDAEVRDDYLVVAGGVVVCGFTGSVVFVSTDGARKAKLGTWNDGTDALAAAFERVAGVRRG